MTDLNAKMTIEVATVYGDAAVMSVLPSAAVPAGAEWPPPEGKRIIYEILGTSGALCSECIQDEDRVTATRAHYGKDKKLKTLPASRNHSWHCTARLRSGGPVVCREYGSRLESAESVPADAAVGYRPYTGPGTWRLYGFCGGRSPDIGPYSDLCVCNECAQDPGNVEPARQAAKTNLRRSDAGLLVAVPRDKVGWQCRVCRRSAE